MNTWLTVAITTIVIFILLAIVYLIYRIVIGQINGKYRIGIFIDMNLSVKKQTLYLNVVNAHRNKELWDASEDVIKLYAAGKEINVVIYKDPKLPGGYKLVCPTLHGSLETISMLNAVKYNTFEMSSDGGYTRIKIHSIDDNLAKKISKWSEAQKTEISQQQRIDMIHEIAKSEKSTNIDSDFSGQRIISHVPEEFSTPTSFRFQALIHWDHPLITKLGFDPDKKISKVYFVHNGDCYLIDCSYIGKKETLYEWDIIGLKPGTIYAGLSFSIDGGKTLFPSSALYGITRNEDGSMPTFEEAKLATSEEGDTKYPFWNSPTSIQYMGENLTKKTFSIIIKKHYEHDNPEEYLSISNAYNFDAGYDWIDKALNPTDETVTELEESQVPIIK